MDGVFAVSLGRFWELPEGREKGAWSLSTRDGRLGRRRDEV